jgi:DNA-binding transcriptional LysR family regulator
MQLPTIMSLVAAGIGIAVIPALLQKLGRAGVNYRAIRESTPKAELVMAWRVEQPSALLQSFEGQLTDDERQEYEEFVENIDLMGILKARARTVLALSVS